MPCSESVVHLSTLQCFSSLSQSLDSHSFFKAVKAFGIEVQVSKPLRHSGPVTCFKPGATRHTLPLFLQYYPLLSIIIHYCTLTLLSIIVHYFIIIITIIIHYYPLLSIIVIPDIIPHIPLSPQGSHGKPGRLEHSCARQQYDLPFASWRPNCIPTSQGLEMLLPSAKSCGLI